MDPYAASCNPPRRAKRTRPAASPAAAAVPPSPTHLVPTQLAGVLQPRPILPKRVPSKTVAGNDSGSGTHSPHIEQDPFDSVPPKPVSRRGRKPGPLSRSAREAQRRLNHSIIEKARRTKINNALATLKQLVPPDYGKNAKPQEGNSESERDDGEDDEDGEYSKSKKGQKTKPSGKKEEKEREYKLEILVRTVAFMQDLLQRVAVLQEANPVCSNCGGGLDSTHSKVSSNPLPSPGLPAPTSEAKDPESGRRHKRARTEQYAQELAETHQISPTGTLPDPIHENHLTRNRLPSISSWLPKTLLNPSAFSVAPSHVDRTNIGKDPIPPLQLPTPPSSGQFYPSAASAPTNITTPLSTGTHSRAMLSPILTRTPEDEHAATMLLQISGTGIGSSPTFRPLPPSIMSPVEPTPQTYYSPSIAQIHPRNSTRIENTILAVQTPSSLLGLTTPPTI